MQITNINGGVLNYKKPLGKIEFKSYNLFCHICKRTMVMKLNACISVIGSNEDVILNDYTVETYSISIDVVRKYSSSIIDSFELLIGTNCVDVKRAFHLIEVYRCNYKDIEGILEDEGYPNADQFKKYEEAHIIRTKKREGGKLKYSPSSKTSVVVLSSESDLGKEIRLKCAR